MFGTPNIYIYIYLTPRCILKSEKKWNNTCGSIGQGDMKKALGIYHFNFFVQLTFFKDLQILHPWPTSHPTIQKKHQKKQQSLRSLRSLFAFGPKSTSVPTHVAIRATDRPGIFHRAVIDESPGRTWISVVFYRDPMSNRDDVTGIPAYLDPSFGCHLLQVPGPFWGVFWGCRP